MDELKDIKVENNRSLIMCGDVHGKFRELVWKVTNQYDLRNADIVVLGDFGVGFDMSIRYDYQRVEKKLDKYDIQFYVMRGNHDDPSWFTGERPESSEFKRITFLQDHKVYNICGRDIYVIGGGGSTDIEMRTPGKDWWEGEYIKEIPMRDLPKKVDIIISHEAPLTFEPVLTRFPETPEEQYENILSGRDFLWSVLQETRCDYWFYGHYHRHYSGSYGNVMYRCLGELELFEVIKKDGV